MSACPLCAGEARAAQPGVLACRACGLVYKEEKYFGPPAYAEGLAEDIYGRAKTGLFAAGLDWLGRRLPGKGRLLDVGCATGELLKAAAARGWLAEGLEPDPALARKAEAGGFSVERGKLGGAGLVPGAYSAVTVFEAFCLMEDPAAAAAGLFGLLRPGGALYAREFNASFHLALAGPEAAGLFRPLGARPAVLHNFNFRARTLRVLLERAGFTEVTVRNSRPTSGDPYRTGGRLGGVLTAGLKVLYYWLAQALWLGTLGRVHAGSALIVTARKPGAAPTR